MHGLCLKIVLIRPSNLSIFHSSAPHLPRLRAYCFKALLHLYWIGLLPLGLQKSVCMVKVCTKSLGLLDFPIHFKFDYVIQLELITSGQCIAQNHGKNRLSNFSVGSVSNKQKIFYHFKQIRLNLC